MAFAAIRAQTVSEREEPSGSYTLHVYTDLVEVPTLVLTPLHSQFGSLTNKSFNVSLGGGPIFHPTDVRLEGNDPISVGILFDGTTVKRDMLKSFAATLANLPPDVFTARDSISVYAYDCELVRAAEARPVSPEALQESMKNIAAKRFGRMPSAPSKSCSLQNRLFDAVARVTTEMGLLPGRRVLVVLSEGTDFSSVNTWLDVALYAESKSVTIFGVRPLYRHISRQSQRSGYSGWVTSEMEDRLGSVCGSTGGLLFESDDSRAMQTAQIRRFVRMLRERYILEFPRPANGNAGNYSMEVKIDDAKAIIRPAGIAFPPRASGTKQPEGTLPEDRSKMPVVGSELDLIPLPK